MPTTWISNINRDNSVRGDAHPANIPMIAAAPWHP